MRMYDLIEKKKRGHALDKAEICWMIQSYTAGQIPDYQMAAFLISGMILVIAGIVIPLF